MKYRREIDGLRAVAVLPVILFHAGFSVFSGGYAGVDIFFVISGFLITSILIGELEQGNFSIARFYERRARRILPALFFVMLACLPFAYMWMLPAQLEDFGLSVIAVIFFASNILFWREEGYFEAAAELKPLLHTWSLAVEEQYYLVIPVFLLLIWRFGRSRAFLSVIAIAVISLLLAEWGWRNQPAANFYLAPTRAWELLAGSICAFLTFGKTQRSSNILSAAGLMMILFSIFIYDAGTPFPSLYTLMPVVGTAFIILFAAQGTWVAKLLSTRPFVGIGLISYSAYLWHQPLFAFARLRSLKEPSEYLMAALAILAMLLAWGTWRCVERPFRTSHKPLPATRSGVFVASGVIGAIFVAIGLAGYIGQGFGWRGSDQVNLVGLDGRVAENRGLHADCEGNFSESPNCSTSNSPRVLLWGDSFAMHLAQGILASDQNVALQQHTTSSCSPILGIAPAGRGKTEDWARLCIDFNNRVLDWLGAQKKVDLVILSSPFEAVLSGRLLLENGEHLQGESSEFVAKKIRETVTEIRAKGAKVLIVSPMPRSDFDNGQCLMRSIYFGENEASCDFALNTNSTPYALLRAVNETVPVYWLYEDFCEGGICDVMQNETMIYRDNGHLSKEGSAYLGKKHDWMQKFMSMAQ